MVKPTSWEQLLLWTDHVVEREDLAEEAMLFVSSHHADVERETEQYYALVLERLLIPGK